MSIEQLVYQIGAGSSGRKIYFIESLKWRSSIDKFSHEDVTGTSCETCLDDAKPKLVWLTNAPPPFSC